MHVVSSRAICEVSQGWLQDLPFSCFYKWQYVCPLYVLNPAYAFQDRSDLGPFDDEETRSFYSSLPDLQALVPSILLTKGQEKETKDEGAAMQLDEDKAAFEAQYGRDGTSDVGELEPDYFKLSAEAKSYC